jgi:hypothetical protein
MTIGPVVGDAISGSGVDVGATVGKVKAGFCVGDGDGNGEIVMGKGVLRPNVLEMVYVPEPARIGVIVRAFPTSE